MDKHSKIVEDYALHLKRFGVMVDEVILKNKKWLLKVELVVGRGLLEVERGAELCEAVFKAADSRSAMYNGGHRDDGTGHRRRLSQALVKFYGWAYNEGLIQRNPYPKNMFPCPPQRKAGFLTDEQLEYLYKCDTLELRDFVLVRFLYDTGFRVKQAAETKLAAIDFKNGAVAAYIKKKDNHHTSPLTNLTLEYIKNWLDLRGVDLNEKERYLFCNRWGEKSTTHAIRERFREISKKVGFRVHPHKIRHTTGTHITERFGQVAAMQLLDHSSPQQTNHYTHLTASKLKKMQETNAKERPVLSSPRYLQKEAV